MRWVNMCSRRPRRHWPCLLFWALLSGTALLSGCIGGNGKAPAESSPPPTLNTMSLIVDAGPAAATGAINHAYVTVKICAPGSQTQCASIDHVLVDTGSVGLRLVRSVLVANSLSLSAQTDAQGQQLEECVTFGAGQTWGPVASVDVTLAGETATSVPMQIMDDTGSGAPPPTSCGANGTLINDVTSFDANGLLGIGVFVQDCGTACADGTSPLPIYFGCSSVGACSAENVALSAQVTNPVAMFAVDNNGVIIQLPNLQNANGDNSVTGELIFGIATQADNAWPSGGLTVLGADASGNFTATYNGGTTVLPARIDSGADSYEFDDPTIPVCPSGAFIGYYCPTVAPMSVFAVNSGVGKNNAVSTVDFAVADPNSFVAGASAFADLAGGAGSTNFTYGMPYFFGRQVYVAIDQRVAGAATGPYYAY